MKLTLQLKLVPTPEPHTALLETMCAFNAGRPLHNVVDKANWF